MYFSYSSRSCFIRDDSPDTLLTKNGYFCFCMSFWNFTIPPIFKKLISICDLLWPLFDSSMPQTWFNIRSKFIYYFTEISGSWNVLWILLQILFYFRSNRNFILDDNLLSLFLDFRSIFLFVLHNIQVYWTKHFPNFLFAYLKFSKYLQFLYSKFPNDPLY